MSRLLGKIIGRLFLLACAFSNRYCSIMGPPASHELAFLREELKRLKAANAVMKQFIRRKRLKPSFLTKCRMIRFALGFRIPLRRVHHYLPMTRSTLLRYLAKVKISFFLLRKKTSKPLSSPSRTPPDITALIWRIKDANANWGYLRIALNLWRLQVFISPSTVRRVLLSPRPDPRRCLKRAADKKPLLHITASKPNSLWSLDLTTLYLFGVFPVSVLGVIDHCSRKVFCLSSTFYPTSAWVVHALSAAFSLFGMPKRVLTDNGSPFVSRAFGDFMTRLGINHIKTSVRHPQTNGKIERFFQSLKYEFLRLFLLTSKKRLDNLLSEYLTYYNKFRLHEALDGQTPDGVFYDRRTMKPDKTAKNIRAPIEEIRMGNGQLKAYRLKEAA